MDGKVLDSFARTNHIPFPLGLIEAEEEKTKFNWGLKSQPWLILTDQDHIVRAEGFTPDELNDKLKALLADRWQAEGLKPGAGVSGP